MHQACDLSAFGVMEIEAGRQLNEVKPSVQIVMVPHGNHGNFRWLDRENGAR